MGLKSKDLDYACEFPDYQSMLAWIKERGTVYLEQEKFWTVRAHLPSKLPADFVLCRKDGQYSDGRRPDSVQVGTLLEDLSRRDFTVNAIAYNEEGDEYIDPYNGRRDIQLHLLRSVGNAADRFGEDALRMLRAIRFSITKGFIMSVDIENCLRYNNDLMLALKNNVSEERKREELFKCFSHDCLKTLKLLNEFWKIRDVCFGSEAKLWLLPTMRDS